MISQPRLEKKGAVAVMSQEVAVIKALLEEATTRQMRLEKLTTSVKAPRGKATPSKASTSGHNRGRR